MFYGPECGLSWGALYHVCLRRMCVLLLLDWIFYKRHLQMFISDAAQSSVPILVSAHISFHYWLRNANVWDMSGPPVLVLVPLGLSYVFWHSIVRCIYIRSSYVCFGELAFLSFCLSVSSKALLVLKPALPAVKQFSFLWWFLLGRASMLNGSCKVGGSTDILTGDTWAQARVVKLMTSQKAIILYT